MADHIQVPPGWVALVGSVGEFARSERTHGVAAPGALKYTDGHRRQLRFYVAPEHRDLGRRLDGFNILVGTPGSHISNPGWVLMRDVEVFNDPGEPDESPWLAECHTCGSSSGATGDDFNDRTEAKRWGHEHDCLDNQPVGWGVDAHDEPHRLEVIQAHVPTFTALRAECGRMVAPTIANPLAPVNCPTCRAYA